MLPQCRGHGSLTRRWLATVTVAFLGLSVLVGTPAKAAAPFELVETLTVNFTSELVVSGDYAYVASSSEITVIDTRTNTIVTPTIALTGVNTPDGAATIGDKVFFAARLSNKLIVLDTTTRTVSYVDTTGCSNPSQLRAVSATRLIANCHGSGNVQVYDVAGTPSIAGTVTTGSGPRGMSVNNGLVYVPNSGTNTVSVIDATATPPVAVGSPIIVGSQPEFTGYIEGKIFSANFAANTVSVIDATSYTVLATLPVGNNPQGLAACGSSMYSANRWSGSTSVMSPLSNSVTDTVTLGGVGAITHVVGATSDYAFFLNFELFSASVVDCSSQQVAATVALTTKPSKVAFSSENAYVTTPGGSGKVFVIALPVSESSSVDSTSETFVDFHFFTTDGRECSAISPQRVQVGTMVELPGVDALCRTMPGSTVAGWTIPVPPGFTGAGSSSLPLSPGHRVRVIDTQRFTVVPFDPVVQFDYDANVAAADTCDEVDVAHGSADGRIAYVWVPRADFAKARTPTQAPCVPAGYELTRWNTEGDGSGTNLELGSPLPDSWHEGLTNHHTLYAVWRARTS